MNDRGIAHATLDADIESSAPKRFHGKVEFLALADPLHLDRIFARRTGISVADARATFSAPPAALFAELGVSALVRVARARLPLVIAVSRWAVRPRVSGCQ